MWTLTPAPTILSLVRTPTLLLSMALLAAPAPLSAQPQRAFEDVREQGVLYFKRGHFKQARSTLDQAAKMPQGAEDFRTALYRGRTLAELLEFAEAYVAIGHAIRLAETPEEKQQAEALRQEVKSLVGPVRFLPAGEEDTGRIELQSRTGVINKKKQRVISSVQSQLRTADVTLPTTVYLPYGDYMANGIQFTLKAPNRAEVEVPLGASVTVDEEDDDATVWWYVGGGVVAATAIGVGAWLLFADDDAQAPPPEIRLNVEGLRAR